MEKIEVSKAEYVNKKARNNGSKNVLIIILILLIVFMSGALTTYYYPSKSNKTIGNSNAKKTMVTSETKVTEEAMEDAIGKVYDSVLCIEVLTDAGEVASTGTGFVYAKDDKYGYILTNAHVISNGKNIQGILSNNNSVELTLLGVDSYSDLAVLRMPISSVLSIATIGNSESMKLGNTVFTVGSPMGSTYAGTVTKGILAGKDRMIEVSTSNGYSSSDSYIVKAIQTDAAINPGNSGGPLVNLAGEVIGITSLKLVDSEIEGMGFAIPIEDAMNYVEFLEKGEKIQRPLLGVQVLDLTNKYILYRYGITVDSSVKAGIILQNVNDGYPAANVGLKAGDIITKVNGEEVVTTAQFKYELYKYKIGETIEITYVRNGKSNTVKVKLDKAS